MTPTMIRVENLCRQFGEQHGGEQHSGTFAVRDLSFSIGKGEVVGLLGPNGAGKSTTMKMLTCYLPPSSGQAWIGKVNLSDPIGVRRQIGYLPENAPSWSDLRVIDHLRFLGRMQGLSSATLKDRVREMAAACHIEQVLHRRIDELSKGFRQRVGLAGAMLHDPAVLILDEPTTGLDPNQIVEIRQLIRSLAVQKTVLLSSHILSEVEAVCDRMMIIDRAELKAMGNSSELAALASAGAQVEICVLGATMEALAEIIELGEVTWQQLAQESEAIRITARHDDPDAPLAEALFRAVVKSGGVLLELRPQRISLEDVFHRLTEEAQ
ncbi:MAG: ATP-binding cassette domain-containing protein [Mariprofundales bacterium]|nr:ATP-binding cassette domain-containing protein [Mariprofundales bacterium]